MRRSEAFGSILSLTRDDQPPLSASLCIARRGARNGQKQREMQTITEILSKLDSGLPVRHALSYPGGSGMVEDRSFTVGRVFSRGFGVMGHNIFLVFGSAFLLLGLPLTLLNQATLQQRTLWINKDPLTGLLAGMLITLPIALVLRALVQACIVRATVADGEGRRAGLGECLGVAIHRFVPLICVSILFALGNVVGLALLIVPGLLFAMVYAVAVPVVVEESVGIFEAFARSSDLTRGVRWKILGLWLVVLILAWLWQTLGRIAVMAADGWQGQAASSLSATLSEMVVTTISAAFVGAMMTGLYVELRNWKDGPAPKRLSEIFG